MGPELTTKWSPTVHTSDPQKGSGLHEISRLIELTLGHLRYHLTDVAPQPNSPPGLVARQMEPELITKWPPIVQTSDPRKGTPLWTRRPSNGSRTDDKITSNSSKNSLTGENWILLVDPRKLFQKNKPDSARIGPSKSHSGIVTRQMAPELTTRWPPTVQT